ncbi:hypothetical protein AgCh_005947 [Apium graveolens]
MCGGRRSSHKDIGLVIGTVTGGMLLIVGVLEISFCIYKRKLTANERNFDPSLPFIANEKLLSWVGDEILPHDSAKLFKVVILFGKAFELFKLEGGMLLTNLCKILPSAMLMNKDSIRSCTNVPGMKQFRGRPFNPYFRFRSRRPYMPGPMFAPYGYG